MIHAEPLRRLGALLLPACAALLLQACATVPEPSLAPVAAACEGCGATTVRMLVVSNRTRSPDPGVVYSARRGTASTLLVDVSIPPGHQPGRVEAPEGPVPDPAREFAVTALRPADDEAMREWADRWVQPAHVLIYVHGFNSSFARTVLRFAQFVHDARLDAAPVLFAWPSAGSATGYLYDRESANYSRDALEDAIRQAVADPRVREVTLMAHSMGTWLAMEALRQHAIRSGAVDPKLRNVVLAAPDLDGEVLFTQLAALGPRRPRFTLLVSQDDRALQVSRLLAGGDRVGMADPTREPMRSILERAPDTTVIDLTDIRAGGRDNHEKFSASPAIVRLIGARMMADQPMEEHEHVTGAVARGALHGITAPVRNLLRLRPRADGGVEAAVP